MPQKPEISSRLMGHLTLRKPLTLLAGIESRSMMSRYHGSKSFGSQESFLTETAICTAKRWRKVWVTILLLRAVKDWKVIHVNFFVFSAMFSGPQFDETQILCYHRGHVT